MTLKYSTAIYDVRSEQQARAIILTPQDGMSVEHRWETETPYVTDLICKKTGIRESSFLLDYGCGIGRLSKSLLDKTGCQYAMGVDSSWSMRALAAAHVQSEKFLTCSPEWFKQLSSGSSATGGVKFDVAIAVWALQHIPFPEVKDAIDRICHLALRKNGRLFVLNEVGRCLPIDGGKWATDNLDIRQLLRGCFHVIEEGAVDPKVMGESAPVHTFWGVYQSAG